MDLNTEAVRLQQVLDELTTVSSFAPGNLIVFGCSSSEIAGQKIGTASSMDIAAALFPVMLR